MALLVIQIWKSDKSFELLMQAVDCKRQNSNFCKLDLGDGLDGGQASQTRLQNVRVPFPGTCDGRTEFYHEINLGGRGGEIVEGSEKPSRVSAYSGTPRADATTAKSIQLGPNTPWSAVAA